MRTLITPLTLLLAPAIAQGAAPKAVVKGPTTALVGQTILLDVIGSASDEKTPLQVKAVGTVPEQPSLRVWYDENRKPGRVEMTAPRPGTYSIAVVATGMCEGETTPMLDFALWLVEVTPPTPPEPIQPVPIPITGNLWGVLVLPESPGRHEAALRTSPAILAAFKASGASYESHLVNGSRMQSAEWKRVLPPDIRVPTMFWLTDRGRVVRTTPSATQASILADLSALRGK